MPCYHAPMKVAALQWDVRRGAAAHNLAAARSALDAAVAGGALLAVLPEVWATSFPRERGQTELLEAAEAGEAWLAEASRAHSLVLAGTHLAPAAGGRFFNRLSVWDGGERVLAYDKLHLFTPTAEQEVFAAGAELPGVADTRIGRLSGAICYDLRFGELFTRMLTAGVEIVVCPAQWPAARAAHWRGLVMGRAIECQAGIVGANRTGSEPVGSGARVLEFSGNSVVADGHGRCLAEGAGQEGAVLAELDTEAMRKLRVRVPVGKDRRPELYREGGSERHTP